MTVTARRHRPARLSAPGMLSRRLLFPSPVCLATLASSGCRPGATSGDVRSPRYFKRALALERVCDALEACAHAGADIRDEGESNHRDQAGNEGIFDRRCTVLIAEEFVQHGKHRTTLVFVLEPGGQLYRRIHLKCHANS